MNKISYLLSIIILIFFAGCQESDEKPVLHRDATGGVQYGGVFHSNEVENFRSLFPHDAGDVSSYNIGSQIYEGLVRLDPKNLEVIPGIAKSWEISEDGLIYTFHLREGVYFHDNPCFENGEGRELDVDDVIYSLTLLSTKSPMNDYFTMIIDRIEGARAYYEYSDSNQKIEEISGLKRIDDHTLQINLTKPFSGMTKVLATASCWIFPQEAYEMYGEEMRVNCVGTGPFRVVKIVDDEVVILGKNKNYWRKDEFGNQLPYLDALKYTFVKEKKSEILEFKKGNLDMVYQIPSDEIEEFKIDVKEDRADFMVDDFRVQITPSLSVQYYSFQHMGEVFNDVNIRKAFNYAIDKNRIVEYGLNGLGVAANFGMVPPSILNYPCNKINGYEYSPELAREHLADAGYPDGKGFPRLVLEINSGGGFENIAVAEIVQKMLSDNLGINVDLSVTNRTQHMDRVGSGKSNFWREAWLADYSDPENFLCLFYGPYAPSDMSESAFINSTRYKSKTFDQLYENANIEQNEAKRMELFCKADQKVIEDAAVIPLYYEKTVRLLKPYVKNFPLNPMEYRDFGSVYFDFQEYNTSLSTLP
jgi:peptide/nickel transport system substrate-binding protein